MWRGALRNVNRRFGSKRTVDSVSRLGAAEVQTFGKFETLPFSAEALAPAGLQGNRAAFSLQSASFAAQASQEEAPGSSEAEAAAEESSAEADTEQHAEEAAEGPNYDDLEPEELRAELIARDAAIAAQTAEAETYKDRLIRSLADMENARQRSAQQAENAKLFSIQRFAKDLLDVPDNLSRAINDVESRSEGEMDAQQAKALLHSLLDGVKLTDKVLQQALANNGIARIDPLRQKFDPNEHNAMFEAPVEGFEPGEIHTVIKAGYTLNGRNLRAADVGIAPLH